MILLKDGWEIDKMRTAGRKLAEVAARVKEAVAPGIKTIELDRITEETILKLGARPAFKGYKVGRAVFPASSCISINEQVIHGIPGSRRIKAGDILKLDFGLVFDGYYADHALTLIVPPEDSEARRLLDATEQSLYQAVARARVGNRIGDIGNAIQTWCESRKLGIVTQFVGHGIGRQMHEEPSVPNFGKANTGYPLQVGMVLAIEPMVTLGAGRTKVLDDQWTAVTVDGSRAAHFEHTVAITPTGPEILTTLQ